METLSAILARAMEDHLAGRLEQAESGYRIVIDQTPDNAHAWHGLGVLATQVGRLREAVSLMQRAIELSPTEATFQHNLGKTLGSLNEHELAIRQFEGLIRLHPNIADAWNDLGNSYRALKLHNKAIAAYETAIRLQADFAFAYFNLGTCYRDLQDQAKAIDFFKTALGISPGLSPAYLDLGCIYTEQGDFGLAVEAFQSALRLRPDWPDALTNLGNAFQQGGQTDLAIQAYQQSLSIDPMVAETYFNLGNLYFFKRQLPSAEAAYRQAFELRTDHVIAATALVHVRQQLGLWEGTQELARSIVRSLDGPPPAGSMYVVDPFNFISFPIPTTPHQQLVATRRAASVFFPKTNPICRARKQRANAGIGLRKIRIGYLSADFHAHATSFLIAEMIESHNRQRFEVFAYSYGPDDSSPMRGRMLRAFDRFRDIQKHTHRRAAEQIAQDEIDILIDLKGYTSQARPDILAMCPAPIQVSFLGYPGTMAVDFVDYIIADSVIASDDYQPFFTEKIINIPGCYQPNDRQADIAPSRPTRAEYGLPDDAIVLGCFNNSYKITPEIMDSWARILEAVPKSVLWLLEWNEWIESNIRREASQRGIQLNRLVFSKLLPNSEHLAREPLADIFVDTFPVVAHTTASDALRVGVPVVTIMGETMISRVAASLLHAVGLPELVATDYNTYESIIIQLANDSTRRHAIREHLIAQAKHGELFDGRAFARKFDNVLESLWNQFESREVVGGIGTRVSPDELYNQGNAFVRNHDYLAAKGCYERALSLRSDFPQALRNLSNTYVMLGSKANDLRHPYEAIQWFESAIRLRPDFGTAHYLLGTVRQRVGQSREAADAYWQAYKLGAPYSPLGLVNQLQILCDWAHVDELTQEIFETVQSDDSKAELIRPFAFLTLLTPTPPSLQLKCARRWSQQFNAIRKVEPGVTPAQRSHHSKIRLGYVSADYRDHATTWLITEMLESHNRDLFETFGYACSPGDGSISHQRIKGSFDTFREVWSLSDDQVAHRIREDEIDILIDLKGYTADGRPEVFARCPAPVQVSFLGFPGTTGADFMDYMVADHFVIPKPQEKAYSEAIAFMPTCYQPNDRKILIADACPSRKELGLPENGLVLGSFNNSYKLSPALMTIWLRLLKTVPGSVLWLLEFNPSMIVHLRAFAEQSQVDPDRLVFASQLPHDQHLARHQAMDLFLDTFPVSAHTTASDTLRMGVPLITLVTESFASRVAGSLLHALHMDQLIAHSYEEYEEIARRLILNPVELRACRAQLQQELANTSCFNGQVFARSIESAYTKMWGRWLRGERPATFDVKDLE
jgi:protein O-GlcNAc transferase